MQLQALTWKSLQRLLLKPEHTCVDEALDGSSRLNDKVQVRCACNAEAGLLLYQECAKLPDLMTRCSPDEIVVGMQVDVVPQS